MREFTKSDESEGAMPEVLDTRPEVLVDDYMTMRDAADRLETSYDALRQYVYANRDRIPVRKIGRSYVLRLSSLTGYSKRGASL